MSRTAPDLPLTGNTMLAAEAFDCRATAALLKAVSPVVWAAHVGAVVAVSFQAWWPLLAWGLVLYFAVRVRLDAALLEMLASDPEFGPGLFDAWLERAGLRARGEARSIKVRCQGARRLVRYLVGAWFLQIGLTAAVILGSR